MYRKVFWAVDVCFLMTFDCASFTQFYSNKVCWCLIWLQGQQNHPPSPSGPVSSGGGGQPHAYCRCVFRQCAGQPQGPSGHGHGTADCVTTADERRGNVPTCPSPTTQSFAGPYTSKRDKGEILARSSCLICLLLYELKFTFIKLQITLIISALWKTHNELIGLFTCYVSRSLFHLLVKSVQH